jgi:hypothetical protein
MSVLSHSRFLALAAANVLLIAVPGCLPFGTLVRVYRRPPSPAEIASAKMVTHADNDMFSNELAALLKLQEPIVVVDLPDPLGDRTDHLCAWIRAWRDGPAVQFREAGGGTRALTGLSSDTGKEKRELLKEQEEVLMKLARGTAAWWNDQQTRQEHISLLESYLIDTRRDQGQLRRIVFYRCELATEPALSVWDQVLHPTPR